MHPLCYRLLCLFCRSSSGIPDGVDVEEAYARLQALHPDGGRSALSANYLENPFSYDLQIIVPAYNAAAYIGECLDSILSQRTFFRVTVTVVDDGSTDGTLSVLRRYAERPGVYLIHQDNQGHSGARNAALKHIRAAYVMFVDADDRLPEGAVEALMQMAARSGADIVEGGYSCFKGERTVFTFRHEEQQTRDWGVLYGYPVGKVYKSWLFDRVSFPLGYWFEDTICIYLLYPRSGTVATIKDVVYAYRQNEQGVTFMSRGNIKTLDALWVTRRVLADCKQMGIPFTPALCDMFLRDMCVALSRFVDLDEAIHRDAFVACAALLGQYFPDCHAKEARLRPLEQALRRYDYGAYRLYGKCYLCV